jgi:hypothetical protein
MDVVVDGHLIMSQDKNIEEQSQSIVTGERVRGERACFQIAAITSISAWNRIATAYRFTPSISQDGSQV